MGGSFSEQLTKVGQVNHPYFGKLTVYKNVNSSEFYHARPLYLRSQQRLRSINLQFQQLRHSNVPWLVLPQSTEVSSRQLCSDNLTVQFWEKHFSHSLKNVLENYKYHKYVLSQSEVLYVTKVILCTERALRALGISQTYTLDNIFVEVEGKLKVYPEVGRQLSQLSAQEITESHKNFVAALKAVIRQLINHWHPYIPISQRMPIINRFLETVQVESLETLLEKLRGWQVATNLKHIEEMSKQVRTIQQTLNSSQKKEDSGRPSSLISRRSTRSASKSKLQVTSRKNMGASISPIVSKFSLLDKIHR